MGPNVGRERTLISTAITAELAREGFLPCVSENVESEITLHSTAVAAELAREGFLSGRLW